MHLAPLAEPSCLDVCIAINYRVFGVAVYGSGVCPVKRKVASQARYKYVYAGTLGLH